MDNYQPDVIFEIDRFRDQIQDFDERICHIAWAQNHHAFGRRIHKDATGSDIVYALYDLAQFDFPAETAAQARLMRLATDPSLFHPSPIEPTFDLNMIGFIYAPLDLATMNAPVKSQGQDIFYVRDIIDAFLALHLYHTDFSVLKVNSFLISFFNDHGIPVTTIDQIPDSLRFIFDEYLIRLMDRKVICDAMLRVSNNVAFYGGDEWKSWPNFAPHYQRRLTKVHDLANAYRDSRLTVHNGTLSIHFRTLEAMACGRPVLVNRTPNDNTPYGIEYYFEPGVDYIPYPFDQFEEVAARSLRDWSHSAAIGENASRRVLEEHTWFHRAQQIIKDVEEL